jgi:cytochrome c2
VVALLASGAGAQGGDPARGARIFQSKRCSECHRPPGQTRVGPSLDELQRPQGAYELAGRLWNHAPSMFTVMRFEGVEWPLIDAAEMADLMAFLRADPARDPAPDPARGRMLLVSKGCLKCHSYRGEGGRIGPELAGLRERYAPPAAWAALVWSHAPRMAVAAVRQGVRYPRFTKDEMTHLIAVLRSAEEPR